MPHKTCCHSVNTAPGELLRHTAPSRFVWQGYNSNYFGIVQRREAGKNIPACLLSFFGWSVGQSSHHRELILPPTHIWVTSPSPQTLLRNLYSMIHSRTYNLSSKKKADLLGEGVINQWREIEKTNQGILRRQTRLMSNAVIIQGPLYVCICFWAHYSISLVYLSVPGAASNCLNTIALK